MKIAFSIPAMLNKQIDIARGSKMKAAALKKETTQAIAGRCKQIALIPGAKYSGQVWIGCEWHYGNDAIDPLDNLPASLKPILDGLVKAKILKDDSSKIIQFPIHHVRVKDDSKTIVLHLFEEYEDYKEWILQNL